MIFNSNTLDMYTHSSTPSQDNNQTPLPQCFTSHHFFSSYFLSQFFDSYNGQFDSCKICSSEYCWQLPLRIPSLLSLATIIATKWITLTVINNTTVDLTVVMFLIWILLTVVTSDTFTTAIDCH